VVVCGLVPVVSCVVLFLLCVCVCDLFIVFPVRLHLTGIHAVGGGTGSRVALGACVCIYIYIFIYIYIYILDI